MKLPKDTLLHLLMQKAVGIISEKDNETVNDILASDPEAAMLWEKIQQIDKRNTESHLFTPKSRSEGWEEVIGAVKQRRRKRSILLIIIILLIFIIISLLIFFGNR